MLCEQIVLDPVVQQLLSSAAEGYVLLLEAIMGTEQGAVIAAWMDRCPDSADVFELDSGRAQVLAALGRLEGDREGFQRERQEHVVRCALGCIETALIPRTPGVVAPKC